MRDWPIEGSREDRIDWWTDFWVENEERIIPMSDVTRPQQDPQPGMTPITALVVADLAERRASGIAKYGGELKSNNGRDALIDAYQESLDQTLYLRQAIEERDNPLVNYTQTTDPNAHLDAIDVSIPPLVIPTGRIDVSRENLTLPPGKFISVDGGLGGAAGIHEMYMGMAQTILQEAQSLVHGDRGEAYGHPIFDMTRTADMVSALLRDKLRVNVRLEAEDVGQMMIAVKMSRHRHMPKRDNLTDTAGYAETLSMIKEWRDANPGVDPRTRY